MAAEFARCNCTAVVKSTGRERRRGGKRGSLEEKPKVVAGDRDDSRPLSLGLLAGQKEQPAALNQPPGTFPQLKEHPFLSLVHWGRMILITGVMELGWLSFLRQLSIRQLGGVL